MFPNEIFLSHASKDKKFANALAQSCDHERLSWTLSLSQFVDFTHSFDNGCRDLLRIWGIGFDPGPRSPA